MLTIDKSVSTLYPTTHMGLLAMQNIPASTPYPQAGVEEAEQAIRTRYGGFNRPGLKALYPIAAYAAYYKRFGCSYHVLAQLESMLQGKNRPFPPSGILRAMFLTELETMLLTAGHDLRSIQLPLQLKAAAGHETYVSISGKTVTATTNDLMVCDARGVLSSVMRGPDRDSRITDATTAVVFSNLRPARHTDGYGRTGVTVIGISNSVVRTIC